MSVHLPTHAGGLSFMVLGSPQAPCLERPLRPHTTWAALLLSEALGVLLALGTALAATALSH